ncbi:hypothetical protein [Bailinhaonella thermotolerans]|uniref:Uncharacterized protein n=1 Tax=Bailinhaonella thermotolerans TaxID=1070861 RepID=A0A3A4BI02_9ACTN|nr:hypothetical protein [Bailinhaonella thermotolerans]RJL34432.1 hypothetical protein D5H75_08360 [Bailinhaonella thermotolerans]
MGSDGVEGVAPPGDDPRAWCVAAVARLARDAPEEALLAAREAVARDPRGEWGHRLASLALARLGRDEDAVASARQAVRLAPGSWSARLRLAAALRRQPGRWTEAWAEALTAARFAPEEPDPHVLLGDLAMLRGDHDQARRAYAVAMRRAEGHLAARVNDALRLLRWERPRGHHDPAWPVDPALTGAARRLLERWSRLVRLLLAVALAPVMIAAYGFARPDLGRIAGAAALAAALAITAVCAARLPRDARPYLAPMLVRDPWLGLSVLITLVVAGAFAAGLVVLAPHFTSAAAGLLGIVLLNPLAVAVSRMLTEAWRGSAIAALTELTTALRTDARDRAARRNLDVALWLMAERLFCVVAAFLAAAWLLPGGRITLAAGAVAVPALMAWVRRRTGLAPYLTRLLHRDRWLAAALASLAVTAPAMAVAAAFPRVWFVAAAGPALAAVFFALRAARAWWRGVPGPWKASLILCEAPGPRLPGDAVPPADLSAHARRAFTYARSIVLTVSDETGEPRAMAVSAVTTVAETGELSLIAGEEAWESARRDPRVAVYVADPFDRRSWIELRGIALPDDRGEVLRITPKRVFTGELPGRHQGRAVP